MTNLNNELSIDALNFVTGGDRGAHNGTGDGPGTGPGALIRLAAAAVDGVIKLVTSVIPH